MGVIENRLFPGSPTRTTARPVPSRDIAQTLQAIRMASPESPEHLCSSHITAGATLRADAAFRSVAEPRVSERSRLVNLSSPASSMRWVSSVTLPEMNALAEHALPADLYDNYVRDRPEPMAFLQSLPAEWPLITSLAMAMDGGRIIEVGMNRSVRHHVPQQEDMSIYTAGLSTCTGVAVVNIGDAGVDVMLAHYDHTQAHKLKQDVSQATSTFARQAGRPVLIACVPESGNKAVDELQASFQKMGYEVHIHTYANELAVDARRSRALIVHAREGKVSIDGMLQRAIDCDFSRDNISQDATRDTSPSRTVRFTDVPEVGNTAGSWHAASSRVAVNFKSLTKMLSVLDSGLSVSTRDIRKLLLMSLAANADHSIVSPKSEKLLLRALDEVNRSPQGGCPAGSLPFDVLRSFIKRGQQVRPDLFR